MPDVPLHNCGRNHDRDAIRMDTPSYTELHTRVRDCLWRDWDPIGVNCFDEATGEYDAYAPTIAAMLLDGADAHKLTAHLRQIETHSMGLTGQCDSTPQVVTKLLDMVGR
ncbi:hypothetical protein [Allorhodopirellula heiligendammensis]|uniref:Uncharacterized protein n=1 Tax=Allorhodopirellula heiligendammensis TaxID=2714739 RepID=A0A5C6B0M2_9BACT|nr:hypothetical protein [Allorhodopirellula heiligendammensis]TWU05448.1 hypothetical protein Poly21_56550 [Allorhodopirellula heiligendammensis]|tara:strand:+ start:403 stop:732 length:330 start_codon:yes stop_codon:yes gene_type:complete